jgi:hypothetical protein
MAGTKLGTWGGSDAADLAAWKTLSSQDANAIGSDPKWSNPGGSTANDYKLLDADTADADPNFILGGYEAIDLVPTPCTCSTGPTRTSSPTQRTSSRTPTTASGGASTSGSTRGSPTRERLLEIAVKRGFRVAMLTAHALTPEALKKLFVDMGFKVIFIPDNMSRLEPYTSELQQMGVEVIYQQDNYHFNFGSWIKENGQYIKAGSGNHLSVFHARIWTDCSSDQNQHNIFSKAIQKSGQPGKRVRAP